MSMTPRLAKRGRFAKVSQSAQRKTIKISPISADSACPVESSLISYSTGVRNLTFYMGINLDVTEKNYTVVFQYQFSAPRKFQKKIANFA